MTFTPNMVEGPTVLQFDLTEDWKAQIIPRGALPTHVESDNGQTLVWCRIRYDLGPHIPLSGSTEPPYSFLADRVLAKKVPSGSGIEYLDAGWPIGTITEGTDEFDVYVHVERDVMCVSVPPADPSDGRTLHSIPTTTP